MNDDIIEEAELITHTAEKTDENALWEYLKKLTPVEIAAKKGRVFSSFNPKMPNFWLKMARDAGFPQDLVDALFQDLQQFPAYSLSAADKILKIQLFLRTQFEKMLFAQMHEPFDQHKEVFIRSYVYAVISSLREEYYKKHKSRLSNDALLQLGSLEKRFGTVFTAVNPLLDKNDIEKVDAVAVLEAMNEEPQKKIWDTHFSPYFSSVSTSQQKTKHTDDAIQSSLIQAITAVVNSQEYRCIGLELAANIIAKELNLEENAGKKSIILSACKGLVTQEYKYFGRSIPGKLLYKPGPRSKILRGFFKALYLQLEPAASKKDPEEDSLSSEAVITKKISKSARQSESDEDPEDSFSYEDNIAITRTPQSTKPIAKKTIAENSLTNNDDKNITELSRQERNQLLQKQWNEVWQAEKPAPSVFKFLTSLRPKAKKNISDKIKEPSAKALYQKIDKNISQLAACKNYNELHDFMRKFMDGWTIKGYSFPKKNYILLKKLEANLDCCAYLEYVEQINALKKSHKNSLVHGHQGSDSFLESLSISTDAQDDDKEKEIDSTGTTLLLEIADEIKSFLKNSRHLQKGNQKHTGLAFIEKYLEIHPVNASNVGVFFSRVQAICDLRLSEKGFFLNLFRKGIPGGGNVEKFYQLFYSTSLMKFDFNENRLVPNIEGLSVLFGKLKGLNQTSENQTKSVPTHQTFSRRAL